MNAPYAIWTDTQVNVYLTDNASTGGNYSVQITSLGEGGTTFVAAPQQLSQAQSNLQEVDVAPPVTPAELIVTNDCYWPQGTGYCAAYTRVVTYRVVGAGPQHKQVYPPSTLPVVRESVTTTSGPKIDGGGVWLRSENSMDSGGRFTDFLCATGQGTSTANQSFAASGVAGNLTVNISNGQYQVLANVYTSTSMTIAQTTSPRACVLGDPTLR